MATSHGRRPMQSSTKTLVPMETNIPCVCFNRFYALQERFCWCKQYAQAQISVKGSVTARLTPLPQEHKDIAQILQLWIHHGVCSRFPLPVPPCMTPQRQPGPPGRVEGARHTRRLSIKTAQFNCVKHVQRQEIWGSYGLVSGRDDLRY